MIPKSTRDEQMHDLIARHLADPAAQMFVLNVLGLAQFCDDVIDGDAEWSESDRWSFITLALIDFPGNPFYLRNSMTLGASMRQAMHQYRAATEVERQAKACAAEGAFEANDDCLPYGMLRHSYELRNTFFDIAVLSVDICHGAEAATRFSAEWYPATRFYETFDEYVAKVTAHERPKKGAYPRGRAGVPVWPGPEADGA